MSAEPLVFLIEGKPAGELRRSRSGIELAYDAEYAASGNTPLSTAFPLADQVAPPQRKVALWLEGLLPDNKAVKRAWRERFNISGKTAFDILSSPVGHDCAGAVQFCSESDAQELVSRSGYVEWLTEVETSEIIQDLRSPRTTWHESEGALGGRFSLAGAQAKTALVRSGERFGVPRGAAPSTVIVKPAIDDPSLPDQAVNEHLCLATASNLGLMSAATEVMEIGGIPCVVAKRYDRISDAQGNAVRVHQEDLCQALGVHPDQKYQSNRGPTPQDIVSLIRTHSSQHEEDVLRFVDALIYNWVIVGTDAHAKNYSLLLRNNTVRLAPLYDISSYLPYPTDWTLVGKSKLAMRIGKRYALAKNDDISAWQRLSASLEIDTDVIVHRAEDIARRLPDAFSDALASVPPKLRYSRTLDRLKDRLQRRSSKCSTMSQHSEMIGGLDGT